MAKRKKINFELIEQSHSAYTILSKMRLQHPSTRDANIGLAWHKALKPDVDGHLVLGKCVKVTDLHKEFMEYDFIIVLNKEVWEDAEFTREKKEALVDHELCHTAVAEDDEGPKWDERDRKVWRVRKHDIEEFQEIVVRHGCYKRDLERFAEALRKKRTTSATLPDMEADTGCVSCNNGLPFEGPGLHVNGARCTREAEASTLASAREAAGGTHARRRKDADAAAVN